MSRLSYLRAKITDKKNALLQINGWKMKGGQIIFTNGCFDILHQGHIVYLAKAAERGNKLIVAINSDNSVRKQNKGSERPVNSEDSRALVLAALGFVDLVVVFDEETPLELIKYLNPNILIKGADYDPNETDPTNKKYIVGSDFIKSSNGKVEVIELEEGFSTTAIIQKLKS